MKRNKTIFHEGTKIGYTLGDLGCCWGQNSSEPCILAIFYTLVLKVNSST